MISFQQIEPFAVSLILGALLGFERAFTSKVHDESGDVLGGIRTFSLIAVFGCASAYLDAMVSGGILIIAYIGIILITVTSYAVSFFKLNERGITTEISILIAFSIGVIAHLQQYRLAAAVTIVVALILYMKKSTARLNARLESDDIMAVLKFAIITFVVLPLFDPSFSLKISTIAPLGDVASSLPPSLRDLELINPHTVWLMVVLISGIGFSGYVLIKVLGSRKGVGLTGLLGGLVSSTATTMEFSKRSRESEQLSLPFALAILLACSTMFPRVLVEVLVVNPRLLGSLLITMSFMALGGLSVCFILWKKTGKEKTGEVPLKNPFTILPAVKFGLLYAAIVLVARLMEKLAGESGLYIVSVLSGLTDVDAITLTMSQLSKQDPAMLDQAAVAITLAAFSNTFMKAFLAVSLGSPRLRKPVLAGFGVIILCGIAGLLVLKLI